MSHVYVTAFGYGKRVVPSSVDCELAVEPEGELHVTSTELSPPGLRSIARDAPVDREGGDRVAEIIAGPSAAEWWLDAGPYAVPLPVGWIAILTGDVSPAFYLVRDPGRAVFIQTSRNRPSIESLVSAGQSLVDKGANEHADWVEVSYQHEGREWQQRHALLRTPTPTMVTAQAPQRVFAEARELHATIVARVIHSA